MALYEDFDLDITTGTKVDDTNVARTARTIMGTCNECITKVYCVTHCDTCQDACSASCGGVSDMPCDR